MKRFAAAIVGLGACLGLLAGPACLAAAEAPVPAPGPAKVTLPLRDYVALVERVEALKKEPRPGEAQADAPLAEVAVQKTAVVLAPAGAASSGDSEAELAARFEA